MHADLVARVPARVYGVVAILYDSVADLQMVTMTGCTFNVDTPVRNYGLAGVGGNVGGKFVLTDCIYNNCKHLGYFGCGGAGYNLFIGIKGGSSRMNNCEKFLYIYDGRTPGIGDRISTDFTGLFIPKAAAIIETYQGIAGIVAARCAAYPNGIIAADNIGTANTDAPTTAQDGIVNMQYKTTDGGGYKKCTVSGVTSTTWGAP